MSSIQSAQSSVLKFVKRWLNLPHNCAPGTAFHPDVLDLPFYLTSMSQLSFLMSWLLNDQLTQ